RSGFFSSGDASVLSAQFFSAAEGWRFSKTSAIGLSATCGLDGCFSMRTPALQFDDRELRAEEQGETSAENDRSVSCQGHPPPASCEEEEVRDRNFPRSRTIPVTRTDNCKSAKGICSTVAARTPG